MILADTSVYVRLIESEKFFCQGIGYIDAHLLASVALTPETPLWTHDKDLREAAKRLGFHAGMD
jgi:hypothetical protein